MSVPLKKHLGAEKRRKKRVRAKITGTAERPRLSVSRSNRYTYAQLIDDSEGNTLGAVSTANFEGKKTKTEQAYEAGKKLAKQALDKDIKKVVFDRGAYRYHGRVKALAEGAREGGLNF